MKPALDAGLKGVVGVGVRAGVRGRERRRYEQRQRGAAEPERPKTEPGWASSDKTTQLLRFCFAIRKMESISPLFFFYHAAVRTECHPAKLLEATSMSAKHIRQDTEEAGAPVSRGSKPGFPISEPCVLAELLTLGLLDYEGGVLIIQPHRLL